MKDTALRICHSIYGPVPCSDGVILQHDEGIYNIQMDGMQGRIDAEGFHCSGYLNPTVAAAAPPASPEPEVSQQQVSTEPELQKACRNLAAILGPGAFSKADYEAMTNQGSASDALLSEVKAMGDDYGGWAAFEANQEREESSEQQISGQTAASTASPAVLRSRCWPFLSRGCLSQLVSAAGRSMASHRS